MVSLGEKASSPPAPTVIVWVAAEAEPVVVDGVTALEEELASVEPYAAKVKGRAPRRKVALLKCMVEYY